MGERTLITWATDTFNPWWGCHKISSECLSCYAEAHANRFHPGHWGLKAPRWFFGDDHWREPLRWNARAARDGVRRRVFCASMADVFELHPVDEIRRKQDDARARLWQLIRETPHLDWLLLTKRPENFAAMLPWMRGPGAECDWCCGSDAIGGHERSCPVAQPWLNVWGGVTAGVRASLYRIGELRDTPFAVRFVSCEPILEHITAEDWDDVLGLGRCEHTIDNAIDLLIVGDESASKPRPAQVDWVRTARDAAARHGVAFHFKQWAGADAPGIDGARSHGRTGKIHLPILDGEVHDAIPRNTP